MPTSHAAGEVRRCAQAWVDAACAVVAGGTSPTLLDAYNTVLVKVSAAPAVPKAKVADRMQILAEQWELAAGLASSCAKAAPDAVRGLECIIGLVSIRGAIESCRQRLHTDPPYPEYPRQVLEVQYRFDTDLTATTLAWAAAVAKAEEGAAKQQAPAASGPRGPGRGVAAPYRTGSSFGGATGVMAKAGMALQGLRTAPQVLGALFLNLHGFLKTLPYGEGGTAAYRYLLEFADSLKGPVSGGGDGSDAGRGVHWREHLRTLWESDDRRRVVELILWHVWGGVYASRMERDPQHVRPPGAASHPLHPHVLTDFELDYFFRHSLAGMPPSEIWGWLDAQRFSERGLWLDRSGAAAGLQMDHAPAGGSTRVTHVLDGRFVHTDRGTFENTLYTFHYHSTTQRYTLRFLDAGVEKTSIVTPVRSAPAGFPPMPTVIQASFVSQIDDRTYVWFRCSSRLDAWYQTMDLATNAPTLNPDGTPALIRRTFVKDDVCTEIQLVTQSMHLTLHSPPSPTLRDDIIKAFLKHPGLASCVITTVRAKIHEYNPQTISVLLQGLSAALLGTVRESWLKGHSNTSYPCVNLASIIGLYLEKRLVQDTSPAEIVMLLRACAREESASNDPLGILRIMSCAARDDFNGTWHWYNGYNNQVFKRAFTITGHHVVYSHPGLCTARPVHAFYSGSAFQMSYDFPLTRFDDQTGRYQESTVRVSISMVRDDNTGEIIGQWCDTDYHEEDVVCWFERAEEEVQPSTRHAEDTRASSRAAATTGASSPVGGALENSALYVVPWGENACTAITGAIETYIKSWDATPSFGLFKNEDPPIDARLFVSRIFPEYSAIPAGKEALYKTLLHLFDACAEQFVTSTRRRQLFTVDSWSLGYALQRSGNDKDDEDQLALVRSSRGLGGLEKLTGLQAEAGALYLRAYTNLREVAWSQVPVLKPAVLALTHIHDVGAFAESIDRAATDLQNRLVSHRISRSAFLMTRKYTLIHEANGVQFPELGVADFQRPCKALGRIKNILVDLEAGWRVVSDAHDVTELETVIKDADFIDLVDLEALEKKWAQRLAVVMDKKDVMTSPLFRAHFVRVCEADAGEDGTVPLAQLEVYFGRAQAALQALTPDTSVGDAVHGVAPEDGHFSDSRRAQESKVLALLGVGEDVIRLLMDGALPLRFMAHDLGAFRKLVRKAPADMVLREEFMSAQERDVLLEENMDYLKLKDTPQKVASIRGASAGCNPRVLAIVRTMLQCERLVAFARDHPQAQDAGLSSVLSNARDLQHAAFQTFLNCAPFINPFVAASAMHGEKFMAEKEALEAGAAEAGAAQRQPLPLEDVSEKTSLRIPVNNTGSLAPHAQPDGFWAMLNAAFGDDDVAKDVRKVQMSLERIATPEEVAKLENMLEEQCGAVDRMISQCRNAAGLGEDEDGNTVPPAVIVVSLPATGQPKLSCKIWRAGAWVERAATEYQDLVYRATLQIQVDPALGVFVRQASECLRAYNAAYTLYSEGHIEFRSRTLTFNHNEGGRATQLLQALSGQWATRAGGETSVFEEVCKEHPPLSCLTPAELVRLADLMRKLAETGARGSQARELVHRWRTPRAAITHRPVATRPAAEETPTFPVAGCRNDHPQALAPTDAHPAVTLTDCGIASGRYLPSLWMYKRAGGDAVLAPSHRGWGLYESASPGAACVLHSTEAHDFHANPWSMRGWESLASAHARHAHPTGHHHHPAELVPTPPSATHLDAERPVRQDVRVKIDGAFDTLPNWSTPNARYKTVDVVAPEKIQPPETAAVGDYLFVKGEVTGLWRALGLDTGAKVLAVTGVKAPGNKNESPAKIQEALVKACSEKCKKGFKLTYQSPWVWDLFPPSMVLDEQSSTRVTRSSMNLRRGGGLAFAMSYASAVDATFRIMVSGDVAGARVGVCIPPEGGGLGSSAADAGTALNKSAFWYASDGTLYRGEAMVGEFPRGRFRSGDIITISHDAKSKSITLKLNGEVLPAGFTGVRLPNGDLKPCVCLREKGAAATITEGEPRLPRDFTWSAADPAPEPAAFSLLQEGRLLRRRPDAWKGATAHTAKPVLTGPGPHTFHVKVHAPAQRYAQVGVGLASPGVFLNKKFDEQANIFGMTVRPDGYVFGINSANVLHTPARPLKPKTVGLNGAPAKPGQDAYRLLTFHVDLGQGSIDVFVNGTERIIHTDMLRKAHPSFPEITGPLVPYVVFDEGQGRAGGDGLGVEFICDEEDVPAGDPSVLVRRMAGGCADLPLPEGIYEKWTPTYVREDGAFQLFNWGGRWVAADPADRPYAWTSACDPSRPLGSQPLYWTSVDGYQQLPKHVRLVTPMRPGGVLQLLPEMINGKVAYRGGNPALTLAWSPAVNRWVVSTSTSGSAVYCSAASGRTTLPHHCADWMWGDGVNWHRHAGVQVVACDGLDALKADAGGLIWCKKSFGSGWEGGAPVKVDDAPSLNAQLCVAAEVQQEGGAQAAARGVMTRDEMAGCHIIRKATGASPSATQLREALLDVSLDSRSSVELRLEWADGEEARRVVRASASQQLARIGQLLSAFSPGGAARLLRAMNYDPNVPRFGMLRSRILRGSIVDVSKLPVADRKIFAMSLFEGDLLPHHILDCTPDTPAEDVRAFLLLYSRVERGRLLVLNLQELPGDLLKEVQFEIEHAAKDGTAEKELLAIITDGDGTDETIEAVDTSVCDIQWKKTAVQQVLKLNHFKSVTYFDHKSGSGKSFTIQRMIEKGHWQGAPSRPTRLDLDASTASLDFVCERLMRPFLEDRGLLVVHVGHDTEPALVNRILDSLIFLGRVQSESGLHVSVPKGTWHMIVEFQEPPKEEEGHVVNPPWRGADGRSDLTLLACRGLAVRGTLAEFDASHYPGLPSALQLVRCYVYQNRAMPEDRLMRAAALGIADIPAVLDDALNATLDSISFRALGRALRYLVHKVTLFLPNPMVSVLPTECRCNVVAQAAVHEMHQFTDPWGPNHFHCPVERHGVKVRFADQMCFQGEVPPKVAAAMKHHLMKIKENFEQLGINSLTPTSTHTAPFHRLLAMLCSEVDVEVGDGLGTLLNNNYVLIPHFLQKLIQVYSHVDLNDLVVLQGPSGTGKSYAVKVLADLLLLNTPTSALRPREGCRNVMKMFSKWVRVDPMVKRNFPDNQADISTAADGKGQVGQGILWKAEQSTPRWCNVEECFGQLAERNSHEALDYVRVCVLDFLSPFFADEEANPDVAELKISNPKDPSSKKKATEEYIEHLNILQNGSKYCDSLVTALLGLVQAFTKISYGFLREQIVRCMEGALRSSKMQQLTGSMYDNFLKILARDRKLEAQTTWARKVLDHTVPYCRERMCRDIKNQVRDELKRSPLLDASEELLAKLADNGTPADPTTGEELESIIAEVATLKRASATKFILMRYDVASATEVFRQLRPLFEQAMACPKIKFCVMIDEMNATRLLGLIKRIVVDRYWDLWEDAYPETGGWLPANIAFIGAINPSKKDASLEGDIDEDVGTAGGGGDENLGFDVTPMPPSLMDFVVPWKQLTKGQIELFISRLLRQNPNLYTFGILENQYALLSGLLLRAHQFAQKACQDKRATISQRDLHRAMKVFDFFFKHGRNYMTDGEHTLDNWAKALSAMLLGIAVSYYFRFPPDQREELSRILTKYLDERVAESRSDSQGFVIRGLPQGTTFKDVVRNAVAAFCSDAHLKLQDAVHAHQGLMENLFVQIVCFELRLAVILEGPPGTSKTLSNNIIRDNMTGRGEFWKEFCHISDICRYQGSAQSSADEIKRKCEEAYRRQRESDNEGATNKRTLLFVDEAGLVRSENDGRKWALKVLHYYLEGANLASVLMTNTTLDPAIGNRCIVVYMAKPAEGELTRMCAGILHRQGLAGLSLEAREVIPLCCRAFHELVPQVTEGTDEMVEYDPSQKYRWWYGLRDLFHMMRHVRRNQPKGGDRAASPPPSAGAGAGAGVSPTNAGGAPTAPNEIVISPEILLRALERNFNGTADLFMGALNIFGRVIGAKFPTYSTESLQGMLRGNVELLLDSIADNNRATEGGGKNLNDMWVRFKLVVDNTDDGSLLQMLRAAEVPGFDDTLSVLSLSALSKNDNLMPVTVVSQIVAAMELGSTVWLTNTRDIDACLFDVFNQSFVVASSGANEVLHFVAIAIGAALEYKQVHRNFQCIVHVTKRELRSMGRLLPSPFLNRLEKFSLAVSDVISYKMATAELSAEGKQLVTSVRARLEEFEKSLVLSRGRCVVSAAPRDTFDSILLEMLYRDTNRQRLPRKPQIAPRISRDPRLRELLFGNNSGDQVWRYSVCRLLQLLSLDHMLLAQGVLTEGANAYLHAYFRGLQPWSLLAYLEDLVAQIHAVDKEASAATQRVWKKNVVYSPANVNFGSLMANVPHVQHINIDSLMGSERGQDVLREALYAYALDSTKAVFVVEVSPASLGSAEVREVRHILNTPPAVQPDEKEQVGNKAVVLLQVLPVTSLTGGNACTPLFGTGWDQVYIDASGDNVDVDMLRYLDPAVAGKRPVQWKDIELSIARAITDLKAAQASVAGEWSPVPSSDPCFCLYDIDEGSLTEQTELAKTLLQCCPAVKQTILQLYHERLPTPQELVAMGQDIAGQEGSVSLPLRLLDGENRIPTSLLMVALRFLFDSRNASALLTLHNNGDVQRLRQSERIIAKALRLTAEPTNFDMLRKMRASQLPPVVVGSTMPSLPGSSALMDALPVPVSATCARATAADLRAQFTGSGVGDLVNLIDEDPGLVKAFFEDSIRARVRFRDTAITSSIVTWVYHLARSLHMVVFGADTPDTVWSIRALCVVDAASLDAYVLAMLPLAAMGVLDSEQALEILHDLDRRAGDEEWVAHELGPRVLLSAFEEMVRKPNGTEHFITACSAMLHRVADAWVVKSQWVPTLKVLAPILWKAKCPPLGLLSFIKTSTAIPPEELSLSIPALRSVLRDAPEALQDVVMACVELHAKLPESHGQKLRPFIFSAVAGNGLPRALCARIITHFIVTTPPPAHDDQATPWEVVRRGCIEAIAPVFYDITKQASGAVGTRAFPPPGDWSHLKQSSVDSVYKNALYLAVFDVCYDQAIGLDGEYISAGTGVCAALARGVISLKEWVDGLAAHPAATAIRTFAGTLMVALQCSFTKFLAVAFMRPPKNEDADYAPSFVTAPERGVIEKLAKTLMEPEGFVMPADGSEEYIRYTTQPPDLEAEYYTQLFFTSLVTGPIPGLHGMGFRQAVQYLNDQRTTAERDAAGGSSGTGGTAMANICGEWIRFKCSNTRAIMSPGVDLAFTTDVHDPLFEAYYLFHRKLVFATELKGNATQQEHEECARELVEQVMSLGSTISQRDKRLIVYYAGFRFYFNERRSAPWAQVFAGSQELRAHLDLSEQQVTVLHIAYDREFMYTVCGPSARNMGIVNTLMEGNKNDWTDVMTTAIALGAADPDSLLGSYILDVQKQRNKFTPGDKTGGPVSCGGGYKIDCVTQLDSNGRIQLYGKNQEILSTGACYLLWGLTFGLWAVQLAWFKDTAMETCWNWLVSGVLKSRDELQPDQARLSDHEHLVQEFMERTVAYHLHMATHTGLTPEDAQKAHATLLGHFRNATENKHPLHRQQHKTREEAKECEAAVEAAWRQLLKEKAAGTWREREMAASPNILDMLNFDTAFHPLKRPSDVAAALERLPVGERPALVTLVLQEKEMLALLGPLLVAVYAFACKVHRLLSGQLPLKYVQADGSGEALTAYRSVLELLKEHTSPQHHADAAALLDRIKRMWDAFRDRVGPIDYECNEGGINIYMRPGAEPRVGAAGLPDTLDFWITLTDRTLDPDHNNVAQGAVQSLTDKYNAVQATLAKRSTLQMEDISLGALSVATPALLLTEQSGLLNIMRSYADADLNVNWTAIEDEVAFASGMVIPALRAANLPVFAFAHETGGDSTLEKRAGDLLRLQPDRWAVPLDETQAKALETRVRHLNEEQHFILLEVLVRAFNTRKARGGQELAEVLETLMQDPQWMGDVAGAHDVLPQRQVVGLFPGLVLDNLAAVMFIISERIAREEWKSAEFCDDLHVAIPREELDAIDARFAAHMEARDYADVTDHLDDLLFILEQLASQFNDQLPANPAKKLAEIFPCLTEHIEALLAEPASEENSACHVYAGLRVEHTINLIRVVRGQQKRLARKRAHGGWREDGAMLREVPLWFRGGAGGGAAGFGITFEDGSSDAGGGGGGDDPMAAGDLGADEEYPLVRAVDENSPAAEAGVLPGMCLVRVDGNVVSTVEEARAALAAASRHDLFEVTATAAGERPDEDEIAKHITRSESYAMLPRLSSSRTMLQQHSSGSWAQA